MASVTGYSVYVGSEGVLTGSARLSQEARDRDAGRLRHQEIERRRREFARRRASLERQIADLQADIEAEEAEVNMIVELGEAQEAIYADDRSRMATTRGTKP
jgi:circadian clock protein KaiC